MKTIRKLLERLRLPLPALAWTPRAAGAPGIAWRTAKADGNLAPMRRHSLPLHPLRSAVPPTADDVRKKLGGPGQSEAGAGLVVRFVADASAGPGVVLFRTGDALDVYLGDGLVRRTSADAVTTLEPPVPEALSAVAADVRVFAALRQGERVHYQDASGRVLGGVLVEKCRYGALVKSDEQRVVGVGFRKLTPAAQTPPA